MRLKVKTEYITFIISGNYIRVQAASIWIFNLENDKFVARYEVPEHIIFSGEGMPSIAVDADPNQCDNAYAYIPDVYNSRLYVYR